LYKIPFLSEEGREDWTNSLEKQIETEPNHSSRSGLRLEQQRGSEKVQKARLSKLGVLIGVFVIFFARKSVVLYFSESWLSILHPSFSLEV